MGTNYYVKTEQKPPCATCGHQEVIEPLHIGKSSFGWQFLFAPYPDHGLTSWAAWQAYLDGKTIVDEYGGESNLGALQEIVTAKEGAMNGFTAPDSAYGAYDRSAHNFLDPDGFWFSNNADFS